MKSTITESSTNIQTYSNQEIQNVLDNCIHNELTRIEVVESHEEVILTGLVYSFYLKSVAQEMVKPYLGNRRLKNRIIVKKA